MGLLNNPRIFRLAINIWPPFRSAGIRVTHVSPDFRRVQVDLKQTLTNRNYVGTHFGGNLFAMVDPFYMIMLINTLGSGYLVWDIEASIRFVRPGKGTVSAEFVLDSATLAHIRQQTASGDKYVHEFVVLIKDAQGETVAEVTKHVYVKRKPPRNPQPSHV